MSTWLDDEPTMAALATQARAARQPLLRALDLCLSGLALVCLALPMGVAVRVGRLQRDAVRGVGGSQFERLSIRLPDTFMARALDALGAAHWPVLLNILRGQMAFVGPRPRAAGESVSPRTLSVRPGLINPWFIRRRTAVDFGTEEQADASYLAARGLGHDTGLLMRGVLASLLPPPVDRVPQRVQVCDVVFDNLSMSEAVARLRDMLDGSKTHHVSFVNPACVNTATAHRGYRRALARAELVLPDGIGIKIGSALLGEPLKQNANGTDLFPRLCEMLQARGASIFLLGGRAGVAESVAEEILRRWPGVRVAGTRDGYFDTVDEGRVAEQVCASGADVLLVARGVPTQDLFIDRHLPLLGVKVAMGVGGLFDFVSGRMPRAPMWMRETGLEWVYRLKQEPGRMWRRYLVGNLSFLARVGLQRLGLRRPALDPLSPGRPDAVCDGSGVRALIFATPRVSNDLPAPADTPAALLPLGCQSVVEAIMDRLLRASITEVDIVISDHPEALRALLGDGTRWGIRIRWHLVADPARPYGVLRSRHLAQAHRLLIGHADTCPSADALLRLTQAEGWALQANGDHGPRWTGWASLATKRLAELPPDMDWDEAAWAMAKQAGPPMLWADQDLTPVHSSLDLLRTTHALDTEPDCEDVPAAWLRTSWGAMSPQSRVHPEARLVGPVRIGPGCIVNRDAVVGPGVVLSHNVWVSSGTSLAHTVVLPDTYLGAGLELAHAVVNGSRVRNVKWGVETALSAQDALLLDLKPPKPAVPSVAPRLLAGFIWVLLAPVIALRAAALRWSDRTADWRTVTVVTGRDDVSRELTTCEVRCATLAASGGEANVWGLMAALRDVAAGRRCWFGVRPRTPSQWYALRPEWQKILCMHPIGLLHAHAWTDDPLQREEASAAADVYLAVQPPAKRAWTILRGLVQPGRGMSR